MIARPILRAGILGVALALSLHGRASAEGFRTGFLSVTLPVIAVLDDELFVGEAIGYIDRTGTIDLRSALDPRSKCAGSFHYTGLYTGVAEMHCDDGLKAALSFRALSPFSGYGSGSTPRGAASFTFGLDAEQATVHLTVPPGKKLVERRDGLRLEAAKH